MTEFGLHQDVYEIDILLDFISGRSDKHMSDLGGQMMDKDGATKLNAARIIEEYYFYRNEIIGGAAIDPIQASFILRLKDILNSFVAPARGLTIAYTLMFSIKDHCYPPTSPSDRLAAAKRAFPGITDSAATFRLMKSILSWGCIGTIIFGAILLSQALYGELLASRFEVAKLKESEAASRLYTALDADKNWNNSQRDLVAVCRIPKDKYTDPDVRSTQLHELCDDFAYKHGLLCASIHDVGSYQNSLVVELANKLLPSHTFGSTLCDSDDHRPPPQPSSFFPGQQEDAPTLFIDLNTLSNYILPILFGLSGSLTAFLRRIQEKVSESVLAPKDRALMVIRVPLGIIAGIAVGLFYNGSAPGAASTASFGVFSLSAAGIAFLAGYGSEAFFRLLDSMIDKVFRLKDASASTSANAPGGTASNR